MDNYHEIMTVEEVAEYLRIGERTVYEWAQRGEIPCGKLSSNWRFRRQDIDRWLDSKLRRNAQKSENDGDLASIISEENILFIPSGSKQDVLYALADKLSASSEVDSSKDLREAIMRREELMSTGIGLGVGVPHVRLDNIHNLVMCAALCAEPIQDYDTVDGEPVRLVFMIGAHTSQHAQYLRLLSQLSTKLKGKEFRDRLLAAGSPAEFRDILVDGKE